MILFTCQAERARKNAEGERDEATSRVSELNIHITSLSNEKRRLEGDNTSMLSELEECRANLVRFNTSYQYCVIFIAAASPSYSTLHTGCCQ